jgi:Zn-dependent alcohol dehydrogenase
MRAAIFTEQDGPLSVEDVTPIDPGPGDVVVRITASGVCHSDLHVIDGTLPFPMPAIMGHEPAGFVEKVGAGVTHLVPGNKVILTLRPPCGLCYWCVRGEVQICPHATAVGSGMLEDGTTRLAHQGRTVYRGTGIAAYSEKVVTMASGAVKVPDDTPLDIACVLGCAVQTGVGAALNTAEIEEGATVMIVGLGGIGISIAQGARLAGASQIIGVDPVDGRRQQAQRFGVTDVIDPAEGDVAARVLSLTGDVGADYAFDAVGKASLIEACIAGIRPGGTAVMVGVPRFDEQVNVPALFFAMTEKKLQGCFLGSSNPQREFPRLLSLWKAGHLDLEGMITSRRPLEQINEAFADMKAGTGLRTVLEIGG